MNMLSLDLEMAQPSGKIIQIGAVAGKIKNGEVIETFSRMVKIDEPISPFIIELTGITQEMNDNGVSLLEAYNDLKAFRRKHKCHKQTIAWGQGDTRVLKEQVREKMPTGPDDWWDFGIRFFDTKTLFQAYMLINEKSMKAGLSKALETFGMEFQGRAHDACADAHNTFLVFIKLCEMLKLAPIEGEKGKDSREVKI